MYTPNHLKQIPPGEIPWGVVTNRHLVPHVAWYEPQTNLSSVARYAYHQFDRGRTIQQEQVVALTNGKKRVLECVTLANGIRYAMVRDAQTHAYVFTAKEFGGVSVAKENNRAWTTDAWFVGRTRHPFMINGTELENKYVLVDFTVSEATGDNPRRCTSIVKKNREQIRDGQPIAYHELRYQVDPLRETFRMGYSYRQADQHVGIILKPQLQQKFSDENTQEILFERVSTSGNMTSQIRLFFSPDGTITSLSVKGAQAFANKTSLREGEARSTNMLDSVTFSKEDLASEVNHQRLERLFGITFPYPLTLDVGLTIEKLLRNIDAKTLRDPRQLLVFHHALPAQFVKV